MHILRFFLICANITIGVLDNDFDGGVIVLVSGMPVMLILSAGHVFFSLRPQGWSLVHYQINILKMKKITQQNLSLAWLASLEMIHRMSDSKMIPV